MVEQGLSSFIAKFLAYLFIFQSGACWGKYEQSFSIVGCMISFFLWFFSLLNLNEFYVTMDTILSQSHCQTFHFREKVHKFFSLCNAFDFPIWIHDANKRENRKSYPPITKHVPRDGYPKLGFRVPEQNHPRNGLTANWEGFFLIFLPIFCTY